MISYKGLGFIISPRLWPHIVSHKRISNSVAYVDFRIPISASSTSIQKSLLFRVVKAYGPTFPKAAQNPKLRDIFYDKLSEAINAPAW